jgi:glycosyltransferase involved in cell wall biosynthesis
MQEIEIYRKGVSVIICAYNGKSRLAKTMEHLVNQEFYCPYEIILIDNASTDGTKEFTDAWWHENGNNKIEYVSYEQPIPGKSYAQELGYSKAKYEYLLVCDDDNWLDKNYIQNGFDIIESNDEIGALGGWSEAVFEKKKPEWFDFYARYFAVSKQGTHSGDITNKKGCLYGAGMVLRKSHWVQINQLGFVPLLTCRKGDTLSSGGDTEYSYVLRLLGYKIWYDERLCIKHFMPEKRMNLEYISKIRKAMSESNFVVSIYVDELEKRGVFQKTFLKRFFKKVRKDFIRNVKKIILGSFEEKEVAKEYFRTLHRLIFSYNDYYVNRATIKRWLPPK